MAALTGSDYCFNHNPAAAAQRAQARKKGGQARHTPHAGAVGGIPDEIKTIDDARRILDYTLSELLASENGIPRARALIAIFDSYLRAFEIGELEERIAALEAQARGE